MKIALICGGPSPERGISLNSARSIVDHLSDEKIEIIPFYLDQSKHAYRISTSQLYSNTPSDFDFKLAETGKPLSREAFVRALKNTDIAFPVMHGAYGEDGGIQGFLEKHGTPFIGSHAAARKNGLDKTSWHEHTRAHGFFAMP